MSISCLALKGKANLPSADIKKRFMIEWVIVTDSWEIYVHTARGDVDIKIAGEGERINAFLQAGTLERADHVTMNPILRSAISQAICVGPQIGRIWVVQFTLFAAVGVKTQKLQFAAHCDWYEASITAREKLADIKGKPKTTYNHHDPSTEQDKPAISEGGYDPHALAKYQKDLRGLEIRGEERLKSAREMDRQ
ncbi:hypothetical protein N7466_011079 [Penicillium verhagenii]|uniref:uncharacterized protein n=1 Tax=Penicillium verhagenii TaxID=1562060 RepID=UPI002545B25A|nr:uncharacterized protein N7466_011079 [Penicillium verhagenii]KAJ5917525.1 hypothetical protein N7466_011079 [Penicillium verhagenii]